MQENVCGTLAIPHCQLPPKYTGEAFGVQYLYNQTGTPFNPKEEDLYTQIDEGFGDIDDDAVSERTDEVPHLAIISPPAGDSDESDAVRI